MVFILAVADPRVIITFIAYGYNNIVNLLDKMSADWVHPNKFAGMHVSFNVDINYIVVLSYANNYIA